MSETVDAVGAAARTEEEVRTVDASTRRLGLGFVGLGQATNLILRRRTELETLPYRVVAAAEVPERAEALARFEEEFGGHGYTSVEELCADPAVDVVYIATLPQQRLDHVTAAARAGKHVIVEKPMASTLEEAQRLIDVADAHGIKLLAGHTHSFDAPILRMQDLVASGELGRLLTILTINHNDFNARPWPTRELEASRGPILNQGPHQVDIVRQIGGGLVRSVRASVFRDELRQVEGGYTAHLTFEDGASAVLSFDARGLFDSGELFGFIGEGGQQRASGLGLRMRQNFGELQQRSRDRADLDAQLEAQKEQGRYGVPDPDGATMGLFGYTGGEVLYQPYFGYTLVTCERGVVRQSPDGLMVYGEQGPVEIPLAHGRTGRTAELLEMYAAVVDARPLFHDGRWGLATLEVCLGILESAATGAEVLMHHQVAAVPVPAGSPA